MTLIQPPVDSWDVNESIDLCFMLIENKIGELLIYFEKFVPKIPELAFIPAP